MNIKVDFIHCRRRETEKNRIYLKARYRVHICILKGCSNRGMEEFYNLFSFSNLLGLLNEADWRKKNM